MVFVNTVVLQFTHISVDVGSEAVASWSGRNADVGVGWSMAEPYVGDNPPTRQVEWRVRLADISAGTFTFLL